MQGRLLVAGLWAGVFEYIRLQGEEKPKRKYIKEPLATPLGDSSLGEKECSWSPFSILFSGFKESIRIRFIIQSNS